MYTYVKKGFAALAVLSLVAGAVPVFAETASTSSVDQIQALLKQIKELQDQIALLQKKQAEVRTEIKDVAVLIRDLSEGMTSEDVKDLQEILAADPDVYPERMITGYYGPLTKLAVMRFQKKHGIEQVGAVGPKTRAKLKELLENDDFKCKAWGQLVAPGLASSTVASKLDLSSCGKVPPGIAKKLDGDWKKNTSDDDDDNEDEDEDEDNDAPTIKGLRAEDVGTSTATVTWRMNEKAKAVVWYDTDNDFDLDDAEKERVPTYKTENEVELEDLNDDTRYFVMVVVTDKAGNTATSSVAEFVTDED